MPWLTHHRVPRLCRVVCGRDSQETAAQSSLFSPGRVRRASARESSCQTPEIGRQRVAGGSGVTLSLRVGSRPRVTKRGAKQCDLTVSPVTKTRVSHTAPQESVRVSLTLSTKDAARAAHAHVLPHVTPTWFHGASSVIVQHDTHKAPKPRLCACAATAVSCCTTTSPTGQPEVLLV